MFQIPSPGDFVAGVGSAIQGAERFVSGAVTGAIAAVENHDSARASDAPAAMVSNPANPGAGSTSLQGVVSTQDFADYQRKVAEALNAIAGDIASLRAYGTDGTNGLYQSQSGGGGFGGGGNNTLLMLLLLGGTTTTLTSNPLLLLLLMGGGGFGGNGGGFDIATALALGLV